EGAVVDGVREGLDAEAVACAEQLLLPFVPDSEREHSAEALDARRPPAPVRAEHDFGVGCRAEAVLTELAAQLDVVVDLAVVRDPVAGAVVHRLLPGLEVDDLEPPVGEPDMTAVVDPHALSVGAAVREQPIHELEPGRERPGRLRIEVEYYSDPAHARLPPPAAGAASLA